MAFRVKDAAEGLHARARARRAARTRPGRPDGAQHPGDQGHRRQPDLSRRPLRRVQRSTTSISCRPAAPIRRRAGVGLTDDRPPDAQRHRGRMDEWAGFYERLFNFREIRYFDIEGKLTGLQSPRDDQPVRQDPHPDQRDPRTTSSRSRNTCATITARASSTSRSATDDIFATVEALRARGVAFLDPPPDTYYEAVDARAARPRRGSRPAAARRHPDRRRADARTAAACCRSSPSTVIGPIFFEIIQRKGNEGFGEGNFQRAVRVDRARPDPPRRAEGVRVGTDASKSAA